MSAQHTPGSWSVLNHQGVFVLDDYGLTVAAVNYQLPDQSGETRRLANARLIAAAPELLEPLLACLHYLENDVPLPNYSGAEKQAAGMAIAKATGASS